MQSSSTIIASQATKIAQGKVELSAQYKTLRSTALNGIKVTIETQCAFFLTKAAFTGIVDAQLIDSVTSCLRDSPEQDTHFKALSQEDKAEVRSQTQILSARFAVTGAKVLAEHASQKMNIKVASKEQEIAEIQRQSAQIKILMEDLFKGVASISLSDFSYKKSAQER